MPRVSVLPDHIASQIAAGEVVERPASVVKELVENSLDAGATQIEIAIGSGGRDIRIADDGCGMDADDAVLAFQRHATSKLASADDLWSLKTLGFRGEALPSIASIARVTCYTRTAEATVGTRLEASEGSVRAAETGCAKGTVLEVHDLFYNVPARMKFLKKASTELGHIEETIQQLAISYPKVMFQLLNDGELILKTSGSGKLAQAIVEAGLFTGNEQLVDVTSAEMKFGMAVYGYLARPLHFRGDRKGILTIINNRPVRCPLSYKALDYAFSDLIPRGKHPFAVLTVTIDPHQVDVNIHPTKREVKYTNSNDVYVAIQRALVDALRQTRQDQRAETDAQEERVSSGGLYGYARAAGSDPSADTRAAAMVAESMPDFATIDGASQSEDLDGREQDGAEDCSRNPQKESFSRETVQQLGFRDRLAASVTAQVRPQNHFASPLRGRASATLPAGWRLVGYVHNTYMILETPEGMRIVEQHIAHERVLYERILAAQTTTGRISESSQRLVISAPLHLSPEQKSVVSDHVDSLQNLGFDFEVHESGAIVCTQVPLELAHKDYPQIVQEMLTQLAAAETANLELEGTKSLACQAAIKNGMPLSEQDLLILLSDWNECPRNDTCPHGRPICLEFSKQKLFEMFHPG